MTQTVLRPGDRVRLLNFLDAFPSDMATVVNGQEGITCIHVDGYDYGEGTTEHFWGTGRHSNWHRVNDPSLLRVELVERRPKPVARFGLSRFLEKEGVL